MEKIKLLVFIIIVTNLSCAQDNNVLDVEQDYEFEVLIPELEIPWGMDFFTDGSMIVTEKEGTIHLYKNGELTPVNNVPDVIVKGQGGLLDVKLHPDFDNNSWVYLSYATNGGSGDLVNTKIGRAKLQGNNLTNFEELYFAEPLTDKPYHFGSRIEFDDQNYLYFSVGDRGNRDENPQDITRDGGKIYRLNDDGSIPSSNPFAGQDGAKEAIFSYGHRNPQGMEIHPVTRKIWTHEHGPKGGDEINIIGAGKNYGWPVISYGINYDGSVLTEKTEKEGMEQPLMHWTPSIAPSGMTFVTSDKYPGLKGHLLVGSLKFAYLELCELDGEQVINRKRLLKNSGRVRSVKQGTDGFIYLGIEGVGVVKILPKS